MILSHDKIVFDVIFNVIMRSLMGKKYDKLIAEKCVEDASEYICLRFRKCQIK